MPVNFDPRTLNTHAFQALSHLRKTYENGKTEEEAKKGLKYQKSQAQELYTYVSTWGLMRLKAEEQAMAHEKKLDKKQKFEVIKQFFKKLEAIAGEAHRDKLTAHNTIEYLCSQYVDANEYLGLTGLAIELANEFAFWANAIYPDISGHIDEN
ncbi:hypothetical protein VB712_17865 [Spirulina sp. CCNP1310]|uniref:hypothetical protein n=1 Tax=Spirulina sp. CCNP1310 TaxID=3110249 RepID=UPI002B213ACA|nr:hypothetical protein [Spirulina sp. CCNP1310]MEA5421096.1 hypothetical protein [Spirulina sp. CCNP1310]